MAKTGTNSRKKTPKPGAGKTQKSPIGKKKTKAQKKRANHANAREGLMAEMSVGEKCGRTSDLKKQEVFITPISEEKLKRGAPLRSAGIKLTKAVPALAAVAHAHRVRIVVRLLAGPASYKELQEVTNLKPGPLYHHINQLRLADVILPKLRDTYELTRGGRNLVLGLLALAPLTNDKRRRPS